MFKSSKLAFLVVAIPVLVVGIGMIAYAYLTPPTNPYYNENDIYYYLGGLFVLMVILLGPFVLFKERDNARKKYLMENGLQGQAEILNRKKTGLYINHQPPIKFLLEITSPDGEIYQTEHKAYLSMLNAGYFNVGAKLPVLIDPNNKKNIALVYSNSDI